MVNFPLAPGNERFSAGGGGSLASGLPATAAEGLGSTLVSAPAGRRSLPGRAKRNTRPATRHTAIPPPASHGQQAGVVRGGRTGPALRRAAVGGGGVFPVCSQQKMPLGLLQTGGVTHLSSTTIHKTLARCGLLRLVNRTISQKIAMSSVTCQHWTHAASVRRASQPSMNRLLR